METSYHIDTTRKTKSYLNQILCLGGQCHLIHLTILRIFSWPGLACMCMKVAENFFYFISFVLLPLPDYAFQSQNQLLRRRFTEQHSAVQIQD